jgi:hypothetical protein
MYLLGSTVLFFVGNFIIGLSAEFKFDLDIKRNFSYCLSVVYTFRMEKKFYKKAIKTKLC